MFDIFFRLRRKASRCKKLIKNLQYQLMLLRNRRHSIVKQLREDIAQLIKLGYEESALNRAEQLFKDESIMAVYDLLDRFCQIVNNQMSYMRENKDLPDINEAVSSLMFASTRCGDLYELPAIGRLFEEHYGQRFATASLAGELVNPELKEKLSIKTVSDDVKYRLIDKIAGGFRQEPGTSIQADPLETPGSVSTLFTSSNADTICTSLSSSDEPSSSESSFEEVILAEKVPQMDNPELIVVYVDDVEDLQSSMTNLSKFLPPPKSGADHHMDGDDDSYGESYMRDRNISSSITTFRINPYAKSSNMKDRDHKIYYDNPYHKHKSHSHHYRKLRKKTIISANYVQKRLVKRPRKSNTTTTTTTYLRAMTMPQLEERSRETQGYRSNSLPNYVHPKLPDYEEILAIFTALKNDSASAA